jgi:hypothetical protein
MVAVNVWQSRIRVDAELDGLVRALLLELEDERSIFS